MEENPKEINAVESTDEVITDSELGKNLKIKSWEEIENIQIEEVVSEEDLEGKTKQEIAEFRFNQTEDSKLAEYITGLRPDSPKMLERLILDQQKVRTKYGLPSMDWVIENPTEHEHFLRDMAKKNNVNIRSKSDCGKFFEENPVGAVYLHQTKTAGVNIDRSTLKTYIKNLIQLEHELIHSMQHIKYPTMPVEAFEYEAYVANCNIEYLKQKPEVLGWGFFGFFVGGSVNSWYGHMNKEKRKNLSRAIKPVWRNPEFFLRNVDKLKEEEIEKHKKGLVTLNDS